MSEPTPCIITVAIPGSLPTKANNPAVPIMVDEQIESTQAAYEAGAVLAGGHFTEGEEPKFGLSGTGTVHPERIWRNSGAQPGGVRVWWRRSGRGRRSRPARS